MKKINISYEKQEPIFKYIFGRSWNELPPVIIKHYANRSYSNDKLTVEGVMEVMCKWYIKPFFYLFNTVPPYNQKNVSVKVNFTSQPHSKAFCLERIFYFKDIKPFYFRSCMYHLKDNEVIEIMKFGICWHFYCLWDGKKVLLKHKNYSWRLFGINILLPITCLIGKTNAEEIAIDDNKFEMAATIIHPLFGKIYEYRGWFKIINTA